MRIAPHEWDRLTEALRAATDLDPVFLDPYHFGEMVLTWDAGRVEDANRLLEKAIRYRKSDWVVPYYLGFNHFYFLHDNVKGSEYLMQASRLPESHRFVGLLASRLSTEAGRTEAAVVFLQEFAEATPDAALRQQLERRLEALKGIAVIERAVTSYRLQYGEPPQRLEQLIEARILKSLPGDPYGGRFFLDAEGRVQTTSRLVSRAIPETRRSEGGR
jgi:tetratricopeptide (TPR) repeat protein